MMARTLRRPLPLVFLLLVIAAMSALGVAASAGASSGGAALARVGSGSSSAATVRARMVARAGECDVPGTHRAIDASWRPDMRAALGYTRTRVGDIAFAVRTQDRFYGDRPDHVEWSASMVKSMLLVAYLNLPSVADRPIDGEGYDLLTAMIEDSDNADADRVDEIVGPQRLDVLARRAGMTQFEAIEPVWGESHVTAADLTRLFLHIDSLVVPRHRRYAMHLLASITPSQRWGIGQVPVPGWTKYFKGGWGSGTGLIDSQVVLLKRGCARVSIAVLTMDDGSHAYGKATLRGIFARLLHGFPPFHGPSDRRGEHAELRLTTS
jgi:hypothetical protein